MRYSVHWSADALMALASIWLRSSDRSQVSATQDLVDDLLSNNPVKNGYLLSEDLFAIEIPPLRVLFERDDTGMIVEVVTVNLLA